MAEASEPFVLGLRYRDIPTGIEGLATAWLDNLYGEPQVKLERCGEDGEPREHWLPPSRLEVASGDLPEGLWRPARSAKTEAQDA